MQNEITLEALLNSLEEPSIEKSASEETAPAPAIEEKGTTSVADDLEALLTKSASEKTTSEETTDMNKEAQEQGMAVADLVLDMLQKQADEGSNAVIQQTEELVEQHDDATELTPREGNTVTETMKGIVARGAGEGAVHPDHLALNANSGEEDGKTGPALETSDEHAVENVDSDLDKEAHEKAAAVSHLVAEGFSFEDATDLVKEAAEEIDAEEYEQVKIASVEALMSEGMDIESAVALTKEAMEIIEDELEKEAAKKAIKTSISDKYHGAKVKAIETAGNLRKGRTAFKEGSKASLKGTKGMSTKGRAKELKKLMSGKSQVAKDMRSGAAQYAGGAALGTAALGGAGYAGHKKMKKAAALEGLVSAGYSVEDALDLLDD